MLEITMKWNLFSECILMISLRIIYLCICMQFLTKISQHKYSSETTNYFTLWFSTPDFFNHLPCLNSFLTIQICLHLINNQWTNFLFLFKYSVRLGKYTSQYRTKRSVASSVLFQL